MPLNIFKVSRTNVPSSADGGPRDRFYPCFSTTIPATEYDRVFIFSIIIFVNSRIAKGISIALLAHNNADESTLSEIIQFQITNKLYELD